MPPQGCSGKINPNPLAGVSQEGASMAGLLEILGAMLGVVIVITTLLLSPFLMLLIILWERYAPKHKLPRNFH